MTSLCQTNELQVTSLLMKVQVKLEKVRQTKEPSALSSVGRRVDPWLLVPLNSAIVNLNSGYNVIGRRSSQGSTDPYANQR